MSRLLGWLGALLAPAEDPRSDAVAFSVDSLLAELRRSRRELAELREQIQARDPGSAVAARLVDEERELLDSEAGLLLELDERRAQAALLRAADARVRAEG